MEHLSSLLNMDPEQLRIAAVVGALLGITGACVTSGCEEVIGRHRHLVCRDGDGTVVVDTHDLDRSPGHDPGVWTWRTTHDTYHEISVPPHSCVYESHDVEPGCGCELDEAQGSRFAKAP